MSIRAYTTVSSRIARGGGSIVISGAGGITLTTAAGQNILYVVSGGGLHQFSGGALSSTAGGVSSFSGPVKVSRALNNAYFYLADSASSGANRGSVGLSSSADVIFNTFTGAAGAETPTEVLRFYNSTGYANVQTRLGVGLSPSYPLDVSGNVNLAGLVAINSTPSTSYQLDVSTSGTSRTVARFVQTGASATTPVVIVKGGATPAAGGRLIEFQNSSGNLLARFSDGSIDNETLYARAVATGFSAAKFEQTTASATVPVVVVKLGATPSTGGDAQHWQDSSGNVWARMLPNGGRSIVFYNTNETAPGTNYEAFTLDWAGNVARWWTSANGTGTLRGLQMGVAGNSIGFYGVTPVARQVLATGAGKTVDNVITALQNLGLVSQT